MHAFIETCFQQTNFLDTSALACVSMPAVLFFKGLEWPMLFAIICVFYHHTLQRKNTMIIRHSLIKSRKVRENMAEMTLTRVSIGLRDASLHWTFDLGTAYG